MDKPAIHLPFISNARVELANVSLQMSNYPPFPTQYHQILFVSAVFLR